MSAIASQLLPHDCLGLLVRDEADRLTLQARSSDTFPEFRRLLFSGGAVFQIVNDLQREQARLIGIDPPDFVERAVAAGYRSLLNVRSVVLNQAIELAFFSKRTHAYGSDDVPTARGIANYIALAVSHDQLAQAERRRSEARVRSELLATQVQPLATGRHQKSGPAPIIGRSLAWRDVLTKALQVAPTETTAFLSGESGTGKEVVARPIHPSSPRMNGPFVALNCAALPETLLESELFGYERGAFTGAQQTKPGQIELASGGVLFLDEVSEMSLLAQAKFLRVLQEREFQRLGGTRLLKANVRVVAATNRDLWDAVARGTFRQDLYYRLQVFDIHLPPLRERPGDIALLTDAFLEDIGQAIGRRTAGVSDEVRQMLLAHEWPGNVRELRNVLERAVILCGGGLITREHVALHSAPAAQSMPADLNAVERRRIEEALADTDWNISKSGKRLGLTRTQMYVRLRKYQLERPAAYAA